MTVHPAPRRLNRRENKALTRQRLLDAARTVFLRDGFHGTTVERVAEEAGFTKGAVYSTFASKGDLFLALYEERLEQRAATWARLLAAGTSDESARAAAHGWVEVMRRDRAWLLLLIEFWAHAARHEALRERFAVLHRRTRERLAELVEARARLAGHRIADPAGHAMAHMALGNGFALESLLDPTIVASDAYESADLALWRGLEAAAAGSTTPRASAARGGSS